MRTNIIGERISILRERNGISQADLARILNIQKSAMSYFENGSRIPKVELVDALCNYFNVSADYLLGRTDIRNPDVDIKLICEKTGLSESVIEKMMEEKKIEDISQEFRKTMGLQEKGFFEVLNYILDYAWPLVYEMMTHLKEGLNICEYWDGIYEELNDFAREEAFLEKLRENSEYGIKLDKLKDNLELSEYRCEKYFRLILSGALSYFDIIPQYSNTGDNIELHHSITRAIESYKYRKIYSIQKKEGEPDGNDTEKE